MRVELEVLNWKSCNRKRLTDLENKLRVTRVEDRGGINEEFEINKYTLLYVK